MDLTSLLFPLLILLLFIPIFLSGRRQRRQVQEMQNLQNALQVGDVVLTTSGLRGTVVDASYEETVDLEIADGVVTTWVRAAVKIKVPAEPAELERVLRRAATILEVDLRPDGAEEIARRSRGTPRIANRLLRRVRDFAEVRADGWVNRQVARDGLAVYDVDELGLDRLDRAVLGALVRSFGGGPVGVSTLAVSVGEEPGTVEEVCEPFLVRAGMLARTPRGRVATAAAWSHLGIAAPPNVTPGGPPALF